MANYKSLVERFLEAAQNTGDIMLRYQYQKAMNMQQLLSKQDYEKLVSDVANKVLSNISVSVDASDVIEQIEELQKELDKLLRMGK